MEKELFVLNRLKAISVDWICKTTIVIHVEQVRYYHNTIKTSIWGDNVFLPILILGVYFSLYPSNDCSLSWGILTCFSFMRHNWQFNLITSPNTNLPSLVCTKLNYEAFCYIVRVPSNVYHKTFGILSFHDIEHM